jgi:cytoskeletal protein RodZ
VEKGLRELRIAVGLDIVDISRKTGITSRYLTAIEKGDFAALPGDIYVRGYIKEYAKCLGIPFPEALEEYETYLRKKRRDERNRAGEGVRSSNILLKLERLLRHKEESEAGQGQPCR